MKLDGKAYSFVSEAAAGLEPDGRRSLQAWLHANRAGGDMPPSILALSIRALECYEAVKLDRLEKARGDDDAESELVNDIRFLQSAIRSLKKHRAAPAMA